MHLAVCTNQTLSVVAVCPVLGRPGIQSGAPILAGPISVSFFNFVTDRFQDPSLVYYEGTQYKVLWWWRHVSCVCVLYVCIAVTVCNHCVACVCILYSVYYDTLCLVV